MNTQCIIFERAKGTKGEGRGRGGGGGTVRGSGETVQKGRGRQTLGLTLLLLGLPCRHSENDLRKSQISNH